MILGNTASILLYFAIFGISILLLFLGEKKKNKLLVILALLLPITLASIRSQVGTDWIAYNQFYEEVAQEDSKEFWRQIVEHETEPMMMFIGWITSTTKSGSWVIFFVYSAITLLFMYLAIRKLVPKNSWLLFGVFLFTAFPDSFNTMRQMAAMSVLAYMFSLLVDCWPRTKREMIILILLLILAINLHYATIALLPILFIPWLSRKIGEKKISYILAILLIFSLSLFPLLIQLLANSGLLSPKHYETLTNDFGSFYNFNFLICIVIGTFSFFYFKKGGNNIFTPLMLLGANYAALGFYSRYLGRLADFFWPFATILAWKILDTFKISSKAKIVVTCSAAAVYFILAYVIMGTSEVIPYGTIF